MVDPGAVSGPGGVAVRATEIGDTGQIHSPVAFTVNHIGTTV
ncbi:MAG: hypothetical protein WCK88_03365 [bacterium]